MIVKCGISLMLFLFFKLKTRQALYILMFCFAFSAKGQKQPHFSPPSLSQSNSVQFIKLQKQLKSSHTKKGLELYYRLAAISLSKNEAIANVYVDLQIQNAAIIDQIETRKEVTLVNLTKIYLETKRFVEAKKVVESAIRKYKLAADYRFECDIRNGDFKSALNNYSECKSIEEALLNEKKTGQIADLGEPYKTANKERQILIQRADLAQRDLYRQNRNAQLFGIITCAMALLITGYLFFNQQKLRNRQFKKESELENAWLKIEAQNRLQEHRFRISRDLHNTIGAQLAFIISSIDNLKYGFDITDQKLNEKLTSISNFTTATIYELRGTIWAMNKTEITFEDLQCRLSNYIDKVQAFDRKIDFSFQVDKNVDLKRKFSAMEGVNIQKVIKEAIHNSLKHSNSKTIEVKVEKSLEYLKFTISDVGSGFDLNTVKMGNGLLNMQKRIHEIGGEFEMVSAQSQGTTINFVL